MHWMTMIKKQHNNIVTIAQLGVLWFVLISLPTVLLFVSSFIPCSNVGGANRNFYPRCSLSQLDRPFISEDKNGRQRSTTRINWIGGRDDRNFNDDGRIYDDPQLLLDLVDEVTTDSTTPDLLEKLERVERALSDVLTTVVANRKPRNKIGPRPPSIPPPMGVFFTDDDTTFHNHNKNDDDPESSQWNIPNIQKAELGLQKIRQRLRQEKETLLRHQSQEKSFQRSSQEDDEILIKAEQALKRSREAAERRRQDAFQRTRQAMAVSTMPERSNSSMRIQRDDDEQQRQQQSLLHGVSTPNKWLQQQQQQRQKRNNATTKNSNKVKIDGRNSVSRRRTVSLDDLTDNVTTKDVRYTSRKPRPTMILGNLLDGMSSKKSTTLRDNGNPVNINNNEIDVQRNPEELPVLYDWVQDDNDGSISGFIHGSSSFRDGAAISTSASVAATTIGAQEGSIITTQSGSQYYLGKPKVWSMNLASVLTGGMFQTQRPSDSLSSAARERHADKDVRKVQNMTAASSGIPIMRSWRLNDEGGISGIVFRSTNAEDGDFIETSTLDDGSVARSGNVVTTLSGSQYYLCDIPVSEEMLEATKAVPNLSPFRRTGTITISKSLNNNNKDNNRRKSRRKGDDVIVDTAMNKLERSSPRTTFSLFDLLGAKPKRPPRPPQTAEVVTLPPKGVPTLTRWTFNDDDGTVSGIVFGSVKINDGDLVITSPIARGIAQQYQVVETITGSTYFLG